MIGLSPKACGFLELGGTYAGAYFLRRGLYMPWELDQVLDHDTWIEGLRRLDPLRYIGGMIEPGPRCAAARVSTLESTIYMRNQLLRDADWSSMAHSLEVRVPLADTKLLSVVSRLDPKVRRAFTRTGNKVVLASAASVRLPAATERPKTGFSIPLVNWHPVVSDRVSDGSKYGSGREWARMVASGSPSL